MTEPVRIGDAELWLGDCREILPRLGAVDAVVTDPPYKLTSGGSVNSTWRGVFSPKVYDNGGHLMSVIPFADWIPLVVNVLRDDADVYIMANDKNVYPLLAEAERNRLKLHNILVWHKPDTRVLNRWYMKNVEFTLYLWKGRAKNINNMGSKQLVSIPNLKPNGHPTEKPVELMEIYVGNSTQAGETVLDPFMGSGTAGVACAKLGRRFIGCEIEPRYFDIACRRIEQAYAQPRLFEEPRPKAQQEALTL